MEREAFRDLPQVFTQNLTNNASRIIRRTIIIVKLVCHNNNLNSNNAMTVFVQSKHVTTSSQVAPVLISKAQSNKRFYVESKL